MAARGTRGEGSLADLFEERASDEPVLVVDVAGFEGPLDLLLMLARQQKVDLTRISILALAEQYLAFVEEARRIRLELAADYLLMAAWLAYLKSRLLLPEPTTDDEPSGEELAEALAARLVKLEAIRVAGAHLVARARLGIDVFERGAPEGIGATTTPLYADTLTDLLAAYARQRQKHALARVRLAVRRVWSLQDARASLERMLGTAPDWTRLDAFVIAWAVPPELRASAMASSFASTLEMTREGVTELRQDGPFRPIYLRRRAPAELAHG